MSKKRNTSVVKGQEGEFFDDHDDAAPAVIEGHERSRISELIERDRPFIEERAKKLRILRDIIADEFAASVIFEQHYSPKLDVVSSFAVFHDEKEVRSKVKAFVRDALPRIGLRIDWEGRDVIDIPIRTERATAQEKMEMLERLE